MLDILARAAFETFSASLGHSVEGLGAPPGAGKRPTTWDHMSPEIREFWRDVARAVLKAEHSYKHVSALAREKTLEKIIK